jgi:hypothetical protein
MRSEEQTWQLLFYITIDCLRLSKNSLDLTFFDIETKQSLF